MSSEGWGNGQQQPQQFGSRSYGNSNFRGGPRGAAGGGRPFNGGGGGWGGQQRGTSAAGANGAYGGGQGGYAGGGGGYGGQRQNYGNRQPRQNYGQAGGAYGANIEGTASSIEIDSNKVGMVIGRGGAKIREIQENFNVHVKIDRDPGENGFTGVTIRGENMAIDAAKNYIQQLVAVKY